MIFKHRKHALHCIVATQEVKSLYAHLSCFTDFGIWVVLACWDSPHTGPKSQTGSWANLLQAPQGTKTVWKRLCGTGSQALSGRPGQRQPGIFMSVWCFTTDKNESRWSTLGMGYWMKSRWVICLGKLIPSHYFLYWIIRFIALVSWSSINEWNPS